MNSPEHITVGGGSVQNGESISVLILAVVIIVVVVVVVITAIITITVVVVIISDATVIKAVMNFMSRVKISFKCLEKSIIAVTWR